MSWAGLPAFGSQMLGHVHIVVKVSCSTTCWMLRLSDQTTTAAEGHHLPFQCWQFLLVVVRAARAAEAADARCQSLNG